MKYRIIRKKYKKDVLINLWLKSMRDWDRIIAQGEEKDPNSYWIARDMWHFDWNECIKRAEKLGFGYHTLNKYYNEWNDKYGIVW